MKSSEFSKNIRKMHLVHKVHSSNQPCYAATSLGTEKTDSACTTHALLVRANIRLALRGPIHDVMYKKERQIFVTGLHT